MPVALHPDTHALIKKIAVANHRTILAQIEKWADDASKV